MDFDDLDDVEETLEASLIAVLDDTGAPDSLKEFLRREGLTSCRKFAGFVRSTEKQDINAELEKNVALQLDPPCNTTKQQLLIRNAWRRCQTLSEQEREEEEAAAPDPAEGPASSPDQQDLTGPPAQQEHLMRPLRDFSDQEFAALPKMTPFEARPRYSKKKWKEVCQQDGKGRHFGMNFPYTIEDLVERGPRWLTTAFHTAGTMSRSNSVKTMKVIPLSLDPLAGDAMGGSSIKIRIEVEYEHPDSTLHTKLFGKLPLTPTDVCERFEHHKWYIDEAEVMFDRFMASACPFRTPKTYFVDHNVETTNFIHIVELLDYSKEWEPSVPGVIAKANQKVYDSEIPKLGIERYMGLWKALAKFVAFFHTDKLGDKRRLAQVFEGVDIMFADAPSPWPQNAADRSKGADLTKYKEYRDNITQQAQGQYHLQIFQMQVGVDFALNCCPQLFPRRCVTREFLLKFMTEVLDVAQYTVEVGWYSTQYHEMWSLFHVNPQLDNGFYFYADEGRTEMEAGLFDWAGFKCLPWSSSLAANLQSGAEPEMLEEHEGNLIRLFLDTYKANGGSERLTHEYVNTCFKLDFCRCIPGTMGFISNVLKDTPRTDPFWKKAKSFSSPEITTNFMKRVNIGAMVHMLEAWRSPKRKLYQWFLDWRKENADIVFERPPPEDVALPAAK